MSPKVLAGVVAGVCVVLLAAACGGLLTVISLSQANQGAFAGPEQPSERIPAMDAASLLNAYKTALAADRQYGGKPIQLRGIVISSQRTRKGPMVQVGDFSGNAVDCYFRSEDEAAEQKPRRSVTLIGTCKGVNAKRTVDLVDCVIVPEAAKPEPK